MAKSLRVQIITLFPDLIMAYAKIGIIARAVKNKVLQLEAVDLRGFGLGVRQVVDDRPFGGGAGMVLRPDVVYRAISAAKGRRKSAKVILMTPQGRRLDHAAAQELAQERDLILVCGRYEGFDERIRQFADDEVSIGDYVLMGGELPALVVTEALIRFVPEVLGKMESTADESFTDGLLEYPQYTKPETWVIKGQKLSVPEVLRTGHHGEINKWREAESRQRTEQRRPDLLK